MVLRESDSTASQKFDDKGKGESGERRTNDKSITSSSIKGLSRSLYEGSFETASPDLVHYC